MIEDIVEQTQRHVHIVLTQRHGRFDFDDVVERTISREKHATFPHPLNDVGRHVVRGHKGLPIMNELDSQEETAPSNVSDDLMAIRDSSKALEKAASQDRRAIL